MDQLKSSIVGLTSQSLDNLDNGGSSLQCQPQYRATFSLNDKKRFCSSLLTDWYKKRTLTIESFTGLPDLAENFIDFVVRNTTFNELSPLKDDMHFLGLFTYTGYHDKYMGYENFVALSPIQVAEEFIAQIDAEDLGPAFFDFVLPYFQHYTRHYSNSFNVSSLFETSIVSLSKTSLKALHSFVIYTTKVGGLQTLDEFFGTNSNQTADFLLNLVEKCFEECEHENLDQVIDDGLDIANKIAVLCDFLVARKNVTDRIIMNLQVLRMLNSLNFRCDYCKMKQIGRSHKETIQLFKRLAKQFVNDAVFALKNLESTARNQNHNRYLNEKHLFKLATSLVPLNFGISTNVQVQHIALNVASDLLTVLRVVAIGTHYANRKSLAFGNKSKIPLDIEYWKLSIGKLNEIRTLAFESVIDEGDCTKFIVEFMLSSSDYHLIQAASNFLTLESANDREHPTGDKLTFCESLELILHCGLSYINESVNAEDKALLYAKQCFKLIRQDNVELIKKELDFLDALQLLNSYGIKDLPFKLHLLENKSQLIDRIFGNDQSAYKDLSNLTSICRLLRIVGHDEKEIRIYVLRRCADQALERQDQTICCEYCRKLIDLGDSCSWTVCQGLSKNLSLRSNSTFRLELLRFCLLNCGSDSLMDVLADYLRAMNDQGVKEEENSEFNDLFYTEEIAEKNFDGIGQKKVNVQVKLLLKEKLSDRFEQSLSDASNLFNNGQLKSAGDVLLEAYHVPQVMATYNTVSHLMKKLKEKL
uniref:Sec39 domain-containing protein n=1 Tax=Romanomermis culicivorax TaxID=13658 RepID=A0A915J3M5_ROMCU